jgi:streptogramin lyase
MVSGPLNSLWFMEPTATNPRLGRSTTNGVITQCPITDSKHSEPGEITVGPDGNIWITGIALTGNGVRIYRYTP